MRIGVSLKLYLGHRETLAWFDRVLEVAARHPEVDLFVLPALTEVAAVASAARGTSVAVGAQDLFWEDRGAFTGEVSGSVLRELGCSCVEVGHAERRAFGEDDSVVARKVAAAFRNGLEPVLCVGEQHRGSPTEAARTCLRQLDAALGSSPSAITVAYEPVWAIGASEPAPGYHISAVCAALREHVAGIPGSRVIYGGSAGPGLLTSLRHSVDGLFLGRFAHDPAALESVLSEVEEVRSWRSA